MGEGSSHGVDYFGREEECLSPTRTRSFPALPRIKARCTKDCIDEKRMQTVN